MLPSFISKKDEGKQGYGENSSQEHLQSHIASIRIFYQFKLNFKLSWQTILTMKRGLEVISIYILSIVLVFYNSSSGYFNRNLISR